MSNMTMVFDALAGFDRHTGNVIMSVFADIEIAEAEIRAYMRKHPSKAQFIWNAFLVLRRPSVLHGKSDVFYLAHVRELLDRVVRGEPLETPTNAEIAAAALEAAMDAPLIRDASVVAAQAFVAALKRANAANRIPAAIAEMAARKPDNPEIVTWVVRATLDGLKRSHPELYEIRRNFWKELAGKPLPPHLAAELDEFMEG